MIRNAIDHGIEDRFERVADGKDETGMIELKISLDGENNYNFELSDDGRGIDFENIRRVAAERGLIEAGDTSVTNARLLNILFSPSFSSRGEVTDISGRGVGLDIVRDTIRDLKGHTSVSTQLKKGTKFKLKIPRPG